MYDQHQPPASAIALTTRYYWMTFLLALFRPKVTIDGQPAPGAWGRTVLPVHPGTHHIDVHVPYLLPPRIGSAQIVVQVQPGQVLEVDYRAPAIAFLDGSIGPPPQQHRGVGAAIALTVVPLVMLLCMCGLFGIGGIGGLIGATADRPVTAPTFPTYSPPTFPTYSPPTFPTTDPTTDAPDSDDDPPLTTGPARTLVGASWGAGDDTYTMGLKDLPFAFRTPGTWGCLAGNTDIPDAQGWVCMDERNPFGTAEEAAREPDTTKRLQVMLRPCPAPCGTAERAAMNKDWFDAGAKITKVDDRTSYVETARDEKGRYTLDMSHFFPADAPKYQVGAWAYSQPDGKDTPQKIVNDILTQAG